eukprot:scaffold9916_cov100-Skeletonema_dohrnii-CCMP3373.AAC.2
MTHHEMTRAEDTIRKEAVTASGESQRLKASLALNPRAVWTEVRADFTHNSPNLPPDKHTTLEPRWQRRSMPRPSSSYSTTQETSWKTISG